jgi:hypothetical protein
MPCINLPLDPVGPTIEIGISLPRSGLAAGAPNPPIRWIKALADTGCSHTSIHSSVALACGLNVLGKNTVTNTSGPVAVNNYHGDLFLRPIIGSGPFEWRFADRGLLELLHQNQHFDALLGMDLLSQGTFSMIGSIKTASFCW